MSWRIIKNLNNAFSSLRKNVLFGCLRVKRVMLIVYTLVLSLLKASSSANISVSFLRLVSKCRVRAVSFFSDERSRLKTAMRSMIFEQSSRRDIEMSHLVDSCTNTLLNIDSSASVPNITNRISRQALIAYARGDILALININYIS